MTEYHFISFKDFDGKQIFSFRADFEWDFLYSKISFKMELIVTNSIFWHFKNKINPNSSTFLFFKSLFQLKNNWFLFI